MFDDLYRQVAAIEMACGLRSPWAGGVAMKIERDWLFIDAEVDEAGHMTKERHDRLWGKIVAYFGRSNWFHYWNDVPAARQPRNQNWYQWCDHVLEEALRLKRKQRKEGRDRGEQVRRIGPGEIELIRA